MAAITGRMRSHLQSNPSTIMARALTLVSLAAALFWTGWTFLMWSRWHPQMPWRDIFVILDELLPLFEGDSHWQDWLLLFEPHYAAHRIALPRTLVALDISFFGGSSQLLYAAGWVGIVMILAIFCRGALGCLRNERTIWVFTCAVAAVLLFAPAHLWNIANAVNTSWHVCVALGLLAFSTLVRRAGPPGLVDWVLAYALATLSALTTFAGVIAWLLLPLAGLSSRRRTLMITVCLSLFLTLLYTRGISSDAQIAATWNAGDPAVIADIQDAGRSAIEANDVTRIVRRAAILLCWPLSATQPVIAGLFFALSLIPLGIGWLRLLLSTSARAGALYPWQKLCLLAAAWCLGVALAVQLGRVIEQPNYAHGPSYERYNTIVALYWIAIVGLLASALVQFRGWRRVAGLAAILLGVQVIIAPGGAYLQQEIASLQTAGRLYAAGENPALREDLDRKLLRFRPEYIYHFDPFFKARELAYAHLPGIDPALDVLPDCPSGLVDLKFVPAAGGGLVEIGATLQGGLHYLTRDMLLFHAGTLYARLYPVYQGDYSPLDLASQSATRWSGAVAVDSSLPDELAITLNMVGPARWSCRLVGPGTGDNPLAAEGAGGAAADV